MKKPIFISGNENKARYLSNHLGLDLEYQKLDLEEIQSLDLREVVEHKVRQAFAKLNQPVLVQDVSLEFVHLGKLPGTFIKYFVDTLPLEKICGLLAGKERGAVARVVYGYLDGEVLQFFEGKLEGEIATAPRGHGGFGWDKIFIPKGYTQTRGEMSKEDDEKTYCSLHPFEEIRHFLGEN